MVKNRIVLRIILSVILISFPIYFLCKLFGKRIYEYIRLMLQKVMEIKTLNTMRKEILKKRIQENKEEYIWSEQDQKDQKSNDVMELYKQDILTKNKDEEEENKPKEQKQLEEKEKKLLEKIIYEALNFKKEGKLDQYEKKLIEGLAIDVDNNELTRLLADLYFTIGNYKKSLSLLKKIIEIDSEDHNAIWQIGEIYLISGDFETSELLVEKAINLKPSNPKYYISLVEILYNTDRKMEAVGVMEKIVKLRPVHVGYMMTLADLYEEMDDIDNSKKYYFRVLEIEPSNEKAKKKIKQYS